MVLIVAIGSLILQFIMGLVSSLGSLVNANASVNIAFQDAHEFDELMKVVARVQV